MRHGKIDELLSSAEKPSRYIGTEVNAVRKDKADVRFLLAFPDTYEVGMSHLGLQILYSIINDIPYASAERCFAPWPDRKKYCVKENCRLRLWSVKSRFRILTWSVFHCNTNFPIPICSICWIWEASRLTAKNAGMDIR